MPEDRKQSAAYKFGSIAGKCGQRPDSNPYPRDELNQHREWENGYRDGEKEKAREQRRNSVA